MNELEASLSQMSVDDAGSADSVELRQPAARRDARRCRASNALTASSSSTTSCAVPPSQRLLGSAFGNWEEQPQFIYWCVYMDTITVRRCLRTVVKERSSVTARTVLDTGDTAGMFCVKYLLMLYYKKKISAEQEKQIADGCFEPPQALKDAARRRWLAAGGPRAPSGILSRLQPRLIADSVASPTPPVTRSQARNHSAALRERINHTHEPANSRASVATPNHRLRPPKRRCPNA